MNIVKNLVRPWIAVTLVGLFAASANAYEISFENGNTDNWQEIAADYGSIPGLLAVTYSDPLRNVANFRFWNAGYSGKPAAFASTSDSTGAGYLTLTPAAGYKVTLNSFFLGSYQGVDRGSSYSVDNLATAGLDLSSGDIVVGSAGLTVTPALTSSKGIVIAFGPSAYNVGINYVNFNVTPVPEPETCAMLMAGLGLLAAVARRRKTGQA